MPGISLSTHVLDMRTGTPAAHVPVSLARVEGDRATFVAEARTDGDGRIASLGNALATGTYRLTFELGTYFRAQGERALFARVTLELDISAEGRYHVPLLASPFGCVSYRGS